MDSPIILKVHLFASSPPSLGYVAGLQELHSEVQLCGSSYMMCTAAHLRGSAFENR